MRHRISGNRLNRNSSLRKATIRDIAKAALKQERICTTTAKAKEARKMVEKLITLGKKGSLADKRRAFAILCDHKIVSDLFNHTAPRFKNRVGGYTRIIRIGNRKGDNAQLALLELTEKKAPVVSKPAKKTVAVKKDKLKKEEAKDKVDIGESKASEAAKTKKEIKPVKSAPVEDKPKEVKKPQGKASPAKPLSGLKKIFKRKSPDK